MIRLLGTLLRLALAAGALYVLYHLGEARLITEVFDVPYEVRFPLWLVALVLLWWLLDRWWQLRRAMLHRRMRRLRQGAMRAFADGKWGKVLRSLKSEPDPLAGHLRASAHQALGAEETADAEWRKAAGGKKRAQRLKARGEAALREAKD